jgi:hypothetical protein
VKREYIDYDPSRGHPAGEDLYFECVRCLCLVSTLSGHRMCLCDLRKDPGDLGRGGSDKTMRLVRVTWMHGDESDINALLKLYLGADEEGSYRPIFREERFKKEFPQNHSEKMRLIAPYLDEDRDRDWTMDFPEDIRRFEAELRQKFPELDAISAKALANRWSFGWK